MIKDSKGKHYEAQGERNINDSLLCYINDMMIDEMTLASFPFSIDAGNLYFNNLHIDHKFFELIISNKALQKKINKIELEYDGIGIASCTIEYSHSLIKCGIAYNNKRHFKRVRL